MKRTIVFIYGLIAYLLFLITILYAIGFVGGFVVPKSINSGTDTGFVNALLVDGLLLSLFAVQHSVMARPAFKKWWTRIVDPSIERSTYVILSSAALLLMYWQWLPATAVIWKVESPVLELILEVIYFFGWLVVVLSTFMINHFELFGLKQVFENFQRRYTHAEITEFKTNFFYTIVRHPIMLGFLIAFWSTPFMTTGHLIFSITTTLYILIAVKFLEERDLRKLYGTAYDDYKKRVPMIVPFTGGRK